MTIRKKQFEASKVLKPVKPQQKLKSIEGIFPKNLDSSENKNKINEIKKLEGQINRNGLIYKSSKYVYDFRKFQTIGSFGDSIFNGKIITNEADKKQDNLLDVILNFNNKVRPRSKADNEERNNTYESTNAQITFIKKVEN